MAEIHIFYPATGTPVVQNDYEAVKPGEHINWRFHSLRSDIKKVRIEFEQTDAYFFPTSSGAQTYMEKDLSVARFIWGIAPDLEGGPDRGDKYKIYALNSSGTSISNAFIDPTIITEKPRP